MSFGPFGNPLVYLGCHGCAGRCRVVAVSDREAEAAGELRFEAVKATVRLVARGRAAGRRVGGWLKSRS